MRWLFTVLFVLLADPAWAQCPSGTSDCSPVTDVPITIVPSGPTTFTALNTYFMAANGNDSCDGTSATIGSSGHCAWATPNHSVVCGDVIIAAAGTYNSNSPGYPFGTVTNCPSTSGGIDGTGGIYFATLLCGGSDLEACPIVQASNIGSEIIDLSNSNWAVEGFKCDGTNGANFCFMTDSGANNRIIHHFAFVNDIAFNAAQAYGTNGCPGGCTHNIPGEGSDYVAIIGSIGNKSNQAGICLGAFDIVAPGVFDQNAGTHHIMYGNISWNNVIPGGCGSDGETYYFDTWDAHGAAYQGVIANNIAWLTDRYGIAETYAFSNTGTSTFLFHHNTIYAGCQTLYTTDFFCGDIATLTGNFTSNMPYNFTIQNNVVLEDFANQGGNSTGAPTYAMALSGKFSNLTIGGTGNENIFKGIRTSCTAALCDTGNNVAENDGAPLGTNTYTNPLFNNVSDLISNRSGTPSCTGFVNVTACMGWNANTQTLTIPSVISDVLATAIGSAPYYSAAANKGYQLPSTTCNSNAEYPAYLKGIVYLHWTGSAIVQNHDLVTTKCGY